MRVVTFGNKDARYGIITIKRNQEGKSIDNTITYWMDDDLSNVKYMVNYCLKKVIEHHREMNHKISIDIDVYDYKEGHYITREVKSYE